MEWKTSALRATAFAFFRLTYNNEPMAVYENCSDGFINSGDTDHQTLHDVDKFFKKKMLLEFSTFFHKLAFSPGETVGATGVQLTRPGADGKTL